MRQRRTMPSASGKVITEAEFRVFQSDFKSFDDNGNGVLDGDEIRALLGKQLGREPSATQVAVSLSCRGWLAAELTWPRRRS